MNVGAFNLVPEVSYTVRISFHSFLFFCSAAMVSSLMSSSSLIHSSALFILLVLLVYFSFQLLYYSVLFVL